MDQTGVFCLELRANGEDLQINQEATTFRYADSLYGLDIYTMHIESSDMARWDRMVKLNEAQDFRLRWYLDRTGGRAYGPWKRLAIQKMKLRYMASSVLVDLDGTCAGLELEVNCHANAFTDMRISEMVERIAQQNQMEPHTKQTDGKYSFFQATMTDAEFIRHLLTHAVSGGVGGYRFGILDGQQLFFAPLSLAGAKTVARFSIRGADMRADTVQLSDFAVTYRRFYDWQEGFRCTEVRGCDVPKREFVSTKANEARTRYPRVAPNSPQSIQTTSEVHISHHPDLGDSARAILQAEADSHWSQKCQGLFRTEVKTYPALGVSPGDLAEVALLDARGQRSYHSGRWIIYEVEHARFPDDNYSLLRLERRNWS